MYDWQMLDLKETILVSNYEYAYFITFFPLPY